MWLKSSITGVFIRGREETKTQGKRPCGEEGRDWSDAERAGKHCQHARGSQGGLDRVLPGTLQREPGSADRCLDFGLLTSRTEYVSAVISHPVVWQSVQAAVGE